MDRLTLNALRFGASGDFGRPGTGEGTDNHKAIQAAIDEAAGYASESLKRRAWVYLPGQLGSYRVSRTLEIPHPWVGLKGDGPGASDIYCDEGPAVRLGIRQTEVLGGKILKLEPHHRPPRAGVLDGTLGGHGWRLGDATLMFHTCPLTHGPRAQTGFGRTGWGETGAFTVEIAFRRQDGGVWPAGEQSGIWLFGGFNRSGQAHSPHVFSLLKGGGENQFDLHLTDSAGNLGTVAIHLPGKGGLLRVMLQVDLSGGTAMAASDGVVIPCEPKGPAFGPNRTGLLRRNEFAPVIFGVDTTACDGRAPVRQRNLKLPDWTLYGFSCSTALRYREARPGEALRRRDGQAVRDETRYGPAGWQDQSLVCWLAGNDPDPMGRTVRAYTRDTVRGYAGLLLQTRQYTEQGGVEGIALRDLSLRTVNGTDSPAVQIGPVLHPEFDNVLLGSSLRGLDTLPILANYFVRANRMRFLGCTEGAYYGAWSILQGRDWAIDNAGACPIRSWASDVRIDGLTIAHASPNTRQIVAIHGGQYGGGHDLRHVIIDYEGERVHDAVVTAENSMGCNAEVVLEDWYLGTAAAGRPVVRLVGIPGATPGRLAARSIDTVDGRQSCLVDALDSPGAWTWSTFETLPPPARPPQQPTRDTKEAPVPMGD